MKLTDPELSLCTSNWLPGKSKKHFTLEILQGRVSTNPAAEPSAGRVCYGRGGGGGEEEVRRSDGVMEEVGLT